MEITRCFISRFFVGRVFFVVRTFGEFPSVELTGFEFYCDDVAEGFVKELYWNSQSAHGGCMSRGLGLDAWLD